MQESEIPKFFNHFKIHTQYSICEGAIKINDLSEFCKSNKIRSLGISDTHNLSGALEFSEKLSKNGTKPIIGSQIVFKYGENEGLLTLIAKNEAGYKSLIKLSSKSYLENDRLSKPHCNFEDLLNLSDGLIVMSGSINSLLGKLFIKGKFDEIDKIYLSLKKIFNNNLYIEIQRHGDLNEKSYENFNLNLSNKYMIPIIASHEVFYIDKSMHTAHEALICIGNKTYLNEKNRISYSNQHYMKSNEEIIKMFEDLPEALENNFRLSYRCNYRPISSDPILPNISSNNEASADKKLIEDSLAGLKDKFEKYFCKNREVLKDHPQYKKYKDRLDHEIKIITSMKYSGYFLIVSDYINWAKKNDIPVGPGRGSGAGSLVAWCLSITDVDPIRFNLIFERFLNPDRISMPDLDIDF